jgi:hypothetical protein
MGLLDELVRGESVKVSGFVAYDGDDVPLEILGAPWHVAVAGHDSRLASLVETVTTMMM